MKGVGCVELQIIVALWLKKNERDVTLKAFTDQRNVFRDVPWNSKTTFAEAMEWFKSETVTMAMFLTQQLFRTIFSRPPSNERKNILPSP